MRLLLSFLLLFTFPLLGAPQVTRCPFLVTGCARSGTTYIFELLNQSGLKVGQERLGPDGCVAWQLACETNYNIYNWNFPRGKIEFGTILHLIRDPIKVINSLYGRSVSPDNLSWDHAWRYILNCCPEILKSDPMPVKCAKYWYYWNLKAENRSTMTFRIEDLSDRLDEFSQMIGFQIDRKVFNKIPKDVNHHPFPNGFRVTWDYLKKNLEPSFFHKFQELAASYGYPVEDDAGSRKKF